MLLDRIFTIKLPEGYSSDAFSDVISQNHDRFQSSCNGLAKRFAILTAVASAVAFMFSLDQCQRVFPCTLDHFSENFGTPIGFCVGTIPLLILMVKCLANEHYQNQFRKLKTQ